MCLYFNGCDVMNNKVILEIPKILLTHRTHVKVTLMYWKIKQLFSTSKDYKDFLLMSHFTHSIHFIILN